MKGKSNFHSWSKDGGEKRKSVRYFWPIFCLLLPIFGLMSALPSWGNLGNVWIEFQSYGNDLRNYLSNQVNSKFNPFQSTINTTINSASGELRIPNPNTTNQDVINQVSQYPIMDKYENNPVLRARKISGILDREMTRGRVEGTLGNGGQARSRNVLENTQNSLQKVNLGVETATNNKQQKQLEIQAAANSLGGLNLDNLNLAGSAFSLLLNNQARLAQLTWEGLADLELQNLNIQQEQTKIMAANLGINKQMQQDLQYTNLNLVNISAEVEDMNRDRRIENATAAARLLRAASQSSLLQLGENMQGENPENLQGVGNRERP